MERLTRSESDRMIAGVCGGLAAYLGIDAILIRAAFLLLIPASGMGLLLYLVLMVIMPSESQSGQPVSENLRLGVESLADSLSQGLGKIGEHPRGPAAAGLMLILLGGFFLLDNLGWVPISIFWSVLLIVAGIYLLRQSR